VPMLTSMRNLFKYLGFIILSSFFSFFAHADRTYFHLWQSTGTTTGALDYTGNAFGIINTTLTNVATGTMSVAYSICSNPGQDGATNYSASDTWIFIPTSINVGGVSIPMTVSVPPGYVNSGVINGFNVIVRRGTVGAGYSWRSCWAPGHSYPLNIRYPDITLTLNVSGLSIGTFNGTIPVRYSFAEYFSVNGSEIKKFSDNDAFTYTTLNNIPYRIEIINKCSLISSSDITIGHGQQSIALANNSVQSAMVTVNCDQPASVSLSLTAMTPPTNRYTDGVGVGLGHGWDSSLTVSNSGISDTSSSRIVNVPSGNSNLIVTSTLKATNAADAGMLQGSAVLTATIQ